MRLLETGQVAAENTIIPGATSWLKQMPKRKLFRREYSNIRLRSEALGLTSGGDQNGPVQQRLLKCVRDLNLASQRSQVLSERLVALSEAVLQYLRAENHEDTSKSRLCLEAELRASRESLGEPVRVVDKGMPVTLSLGEGAIIDYKDELSLLVTNLGSALGAKTGMLLTVMRGKVTVGSARIVNVRERISGAVLEKTSSRNSSVRVGDQVKLATF